MRVLVFILLFFGELFSAEDASDNQKVKKITFLVFATVEEQIKHCKKCYPLYRKVFPGLLKENSELSQEEVNKITPSQEEALRLLEALRESIKHSSSCKKHLRALLKK